MKYYFTLLIAAFTITSCDDHTLNEPANSSLEVNNISTARIGYTRNEVFEGGNSLGQSGIDINGNFAVAGEPGYDDLFLQGRGALHVYTRSAPEGAWTKAAILKHTRAKANDNLGYWAVINDDYVVSATNDSIYAFKRSGNLWKQQKAFVPSNLPAEGLSVSSLDLFGDYLVVGHSSLKINGAWNIGAIYIFKQSNGKWIQQARIVSPNNKEYDWFGSDVAIDGNYLLVGARGGYIPQPGSSGIGSHGGKVYVYGRTGLDQWVLLPNANLAPNDIVLGDYYGEKIDFRGNNAIISASRQRVNGVVTGSAYIYKRNGSTWTLKQKLTPPAGDKFGSAIAINDNYVLINDGSYDGGINIFKTNGISYSLLRKETDQQYHHFGSQLALDNVNTYMNSGFCCPAQVRFMPVE